MAFPAYTRATLVTLEVGSVIQGKYRIVSLIGRGGMGSVYAGENTAIARRVAIKVLHGDVSAHPEAIERFEREAQAAGRIGNDHILEVLDLGELPSGERFMVMEYLDGETLEERLDRSGVLTAAELYPLVRQLLLGLGAAHSKGIIHRDLKPENVFILNTKAGTADFVKIIDFGISKFSDSVDLRMTATGAVMGTPYYMSPEQAKGAKGIDTRSDLYAVGVLLYRAATGHVPYAGENFNEILFKIVLSNPPSMRELQPSLDPAFESIVVKAMAREAESRFQSAAEFITALDAWHAEGRGVSAPPPERASVTSYPSYPPGTLPIATAGDITTGEWTRSGMPSSRKPSAVTWVVGALLLGGAAAALAFSLSEPQKTDEIVGATETPLSVTEEAPSGVDSAPSVEPPSIDPAQVEQTQAAEPSIDLAETEAASSDDTERDDVDEGDSNDKPKPSVAKRPTKASKIVKPRPRAPKKPPEPTPAKKPSADELDFGY